MNKATHYFIKCCKHRSEIKFIIYIIIIIILKAVLVFSSFARDSNLEIGQLARYRKNLLRDANSGCKRVLANWSHKFAE